MVCLEPYGLTLGLEVGGQSEFVADGSWQAIKWRTGNACGQLVG